MAKFAFGRHLLYWELIIHLDGIANDLLEKIYIYITYIYLNITVCFHIKEFLSYQTPIFKLFDGNLMKVCPIDEYSDVYCDPIYMTTAAHQIVLTRYDRMFFKYGGYTNTKHIRLYLPGGIRHSLISPSTTYMRQWTGSTLVQIIIN